MRSPLLPPHGALAQAEPAECLAGPEEETVAEIASVYTSAQGTRMQREGQADGQRSTSNRNSLYQGLAQFFPIISYFLFSFPLFQLESEVEVLKCYQQSCPGSEGVHSSQEIPFSPRYQAILLVEG